MAASRQVKSNEPLEIGYKLDMIIRLLAAILTKGTNKTESIAALGKLQLSPGDIAGIVGVTAHHVRQTLYIERKKAGNERTGNTHLEDPLAGGEETV